jgi:MFS family permease
MKNRNFILFLIASGILGITQSIDSSFFNNFLNDTFRITVEQRTWLEIPREFPGFLVVFATGLLVFLADIRIAAIANIIAAVGMMGIGYLSKGYGTVVVWLTIYSMGQHLFMPMSNSIGMDLGEDANAGKRLGQISGVTTAVFLITSLLTAIIFKNIKVNYHIAFIVSSLAFMASAAMILMMKTHKDTKEKKRLVIRKEYKLFYLLSIVYGARKQIFITFGPWVLIKVFNQGVSTFAMLGFITAGLGILVKPLIGNLIDKKGEKFVLAWEAIMLILVCAVYALSKVFFDSIGLGYIALFFICGSFVADQMLAATSMARATYLKKIAVRPEDVSPTLSMGISIDHLVSMFIPVIGGVVWHFAGYEFVFLGGALIALLNLYLVNKIELGNKQELKNGLFEQVN